MERLIDFELLEAIASGDNTRIRQVRIKRNIKGVIERLQVLDEDGQNLDGNGDLKLTANKEKLEKALSETTLPNVSRAYRDLLMDFPVQAPFLFEDFEPDLLEGSQITRVGPLIMYVLQQSNKGERIPPTYSQLYIEAFKVGVFD